MNTNPNRLRREGAAAEHQAILEAVLERDSDRSCQLLTEHYQTTLEDLRQVILGQTDPNVASGNDLDRP